MSSRKETVGKPLSLASLVLDFSQYSPHLPQLYDFSWDSDLKWSLSTISTPNLSKDPHPFMESALKTDGKFSNFQKELL